MRSLSRNGVRGLCCCLPSEQQDGVSHPWVRICPLSVVVGGEHQAVPLQRCWGASCSVLPGVAAALLCPGFPENLSWISPSADPARWGCSGTAMGLCREDASIPIMISLQDIPLADALFLKQTLQPGCWLVYSSQLMQLQKHDGSALVLLGMRDELPK